jgi:signal transduction histidine kinase
MATRAVIARSRSRALVAAVLLVLLLAALLGAWFVSGWHDVRMQQKQARTQPHTAAAALATELARELRGELDALLSREVRRPYFHYQNLMHDPKASGSVSVTPSPLAKTPEDDLVLGYFQIDGKGRATTPTINDDVPQLSDPDHLAANRMFRDQVVRDLVAVLTPPEATASVLVAEAPKATPRVPTPRPVPQVQAQSIQIDSSSYSMNSNSNAVWQSDPSFAATPSGPTAPRPTPKSSQTPATPPPPVTITVTALEWQTLTFAGLPALVAVRQVQTPDGVLAQGLVIDRSTLTTWLAGKAGDMVAELHPPGTLAEPVAPEIAPGWQLTVTPNPRALAAAAVDSLGVARAFLLRFFVIGGIALLAAALVLVLLMRAERLARERSQFAAAAAHELRTPLAGLQLYGDMLADGLGDPGKLEDYARRMSEEAARLGRVVSNVLGFSQLERGNLSVKADVADLAAELQSLAERSQPALDRAGAALELDIDPTLRARFDRDALARIVGNLIDNAEKYARESDDRTITLAARDRGDTVEVTVTDRGPGIANPDPLFRPFARGVSDDGPAGLGLGLALSRSLAHAMGGELSYRRAEGGGATLVLTLSRA